MSWRPCSISTVLFLPDQPVNPPHPDHPEDPDRPEDPEHPEHPEMELSSSQKCFNKDLFKRVFKEYFFIGNNLKYFVILKGLFGGFKFIKMILFGRKARRLLCVHLNI
jgi:hypothetical protein